MRMLKKIPVRLAAKVPRVCSGEFAIVSINVLTDSCIELSELFCEVADEGVSCWFVAA